MERDPAHFEEEPSLRREFCEQQSLDEFAAERAEQVTNIWRGLRDAVIEEGLIEPQPYD